MSEYMMCDSLDNKTIQQLKSDYYNLLQTWSHTHDNAQSFHHIVRGAHLV